jgi:transposase
MEGACLLALPEGMQIEQIQITGNGLVIQIAATTPTSCCPLCAEISSSIHCHYQRTLRGTPCAGRRVQLLLTVRKFTCRNPYCDRTTASRTSPSSLSKNGDLQNQRMWRKSVSPTCGPICALSTGRGTQPSGVSDQRDCGAGWAE